MRFGISHFTSDRGIAPAVAAAAAEEHGFSAFYVPEHTHIPVRRDTVYPGITDDRLPADRFTRSLDPWVALSTAATVTNRIRLGTAVALPLQHDPIALAKTVASLDHLSGGRVILGAGFGWNMEEMRHHGVNIAGRRTTLRHYIEAMRALWTEEEASYRSGPVSFAASWARPKPIQARLPVLLGASGTDRTFAWIASTADGWIAMPSEVDIASSVQRLTRMWGEAGREGRPEVVLVGPPPDGQTVTRLETAGVTEMVLGLPHGDAGQALDFIARQGEHVKQFA